MRGQVLHGFVGGDAWQIDFVQSDDDRNASGFRVTDGFLSLRHDTIVCGDNQYNDVGYVGTTSTHFGERFVTGCIDEGDFLVTFFDLVGTDVLSNTTGFTGDHIDADQGIQQRCFSVVNVTQESHDRCARLEFVWIVFFKL